MVYAGEVARGTEEGDAAGHGLKGVQGLGESCDWNREATVAKGG